MKTIALLAIVAFTALASFHHRADADPGALDLTFGNGGKVTTAIGGSYNGGQSVAIQSDARIVVAGWSSTPDGSGTDFALVRYDTDGNLDNTFNGTGKVITDLSRNDAGNSVVLQSDAKIVVAGFSSVSNGTDRNFAVVRYESDGSLDTTFGGTGKVTTDFGGTDIGTSVAMQSDGKVLVAGHSHAGINTVFALARYNTNGSLDTSFNGTGKVTTAIGGYASGKCVAVQTDGKIVVAGEGGGIVVVRYDADGSLDTSFNGTGKVVTSVNGSGFAYSVAIQIDGRIVVAGGAFSAEADHNFALARYNPNGSLDTTFNGTGTLTTVIGSTSDINTATSVAIQHDGKIVVAGTSRNAVKGNFAVVRYTSIGTLDPIFGGTGIVTTSVSSGDDGALGMALQNDGKIVVAGVANGGINDGFAVVRYGELDTDGDGIPDRYETGTGIYVSPQDTGTSPTNPDTDCDGLLDGVENNTGTFVDATHTGSNPNIKDTDGDGFDDGFEVTTGFNPTSAASTPDTLSSIRTAAEYRFAAALGISYRIEASTDLANWTTIETNIIGAGGVITRFYSIEGQPKQFFRSRRN